MNNCSSQGPRQVCPNMFATPEGRDLVRGCPEDLAVGSRGNPVLGDVFEDLRVVSQGLACLFHFLLTDWGVILCASPGKPKPY